MPTGSRATRFSTSYVLIPEDEYRRWKSSSKRETIGKVSPLEDTNVRAVKRTRRDLESSLGDADISAYDKMLSNADGMRRYVEQIKRAKRRSDYAPRRRLPSIPRQRAHLPPPRRQSPRRERETRSPSPPRRDYVRAELRMSSPDGSIRDSSEERALIAEREIDTRADERTSKEMRRLDADEILSRMTPRSVADNVRSRLPLSVKEIKRREAAKKAAQRREEAREVREYFDAEDPSRKTKRHRGSKGRKKRQTGQGFGLVGRWQGLA